MPPHEGPEVVTRAGPGAGRRWRTAGLPGVGGRLKVEPEDFIVEEVPEVAPSGAGEHLWLWIEKRDLDHLTLLAELAGALGIREEAIGYAGMKDKRAVTRQWFSVPAAAEVRLAHLALAGVQVHRVVRHHEKLRTGRLAGNRFDVRLRGTAARAEGAAEILAALAVRGMANFYDAQRFGREEETLASGRAALAALARGEPPRLSGKRLRLALSAVQAALFNDVLARRLADDLVDQPLEGDVILERRTGLWRWIEAADLASAAARCAAREIVPTGPMFGPKMRRPRATARAREAAVLAAWGLSTADFAHGKLTAGTRRPFLVWPTEVRAAAAPDGLQLSFTLPAGSYATVVLDEVMKLDALARA